MDTLAINPTTQSQINQFMNSPGHFLLLVGVDGVGKTAVAEQMLSKALRVSQDKLHKLPYFYLLKTDTASISINDVRELQKFVRLKTVGSDSLRRGLLIEHADKLTSEAQNALLKLLEEPPEDTIILLTVSRPENLLQTIVSRSQIINIRRPSNQQLKAFFKSAGYDDFQITKAFSLSGGLPGLMHALLDEDTEHPLFASVDTAKRLLGLPRFDKLALVGDISKDKVKLNELLFAVVRIAETSLFQSTKSKQTATTKNWLNILRETLHAQEALYLNGNSRLVLTNLFMNI